MQVLVSTHRTLTLVDTSNDCVTDIITKKDGLLFGITWNKKNVFLLSRNNPFQKETIMVFDNSLKHLHDIKFKQGDEILGGHQILCHNDMLHIMSSDKRRITSVDVNNTNNVIHFNWPNANWATHINSIWNIPDTNYFYIIEHNGGKPPSKLCVIEWVNDKFEFVNRFKEGIGLHCHNILWEPEKQMFTTLSSLEFSLKKIRYNMQKCLLNTETQKNIHALGHTRWYVRGLGYNGQYYAVGLSMHQEIKDPDPEVRREERRKLHCGGLVILNNSLNVTKEFNLSGRGQIHDVRIVNEVDYAHHHTPLMIGQ